MQITTHARLASRHPLPDEPRLDDAHPNVFISYAQESAGHNALVLAFTRSLRDCGVAVTFDQDATHHRIDWQVWATRNILRCDFVLVVASPTCRRVGDGDTEPQHHRGLQAEMRTLRDLYACDHPRWLRRILPVILPGGSVDDIPLFLQPYNADHYPIARLDRAGLAPLLRALGAEVG